MTQYGALCSEAAEVTFILRVQTDDYSKLEEAHIFLYKQHSVFMHLTNAGQSTSYIGFEMVG